MSMHTLDYHVEFLRSPLHQIDVTLTLHVPDVSGQILRFPTWTPGSYLIREHARNIIQISASTLSGQSLTIKKLDKNTWQLPALPATCTIVVHYVIYAWDLSVRSCYFDQGRAFFDGAALFFAVENQTHIPHRVRVTCADQSWQIATALMPVEHEITMLYGNTQLFHAENYRQLMDCPFECGVFQSQTFVTGGCIHRVIVAGVVPLLDWKTLISDLQKICQTQIDFFEPDTHRSPNHHYLFLIYATDDGYGGLEHQSSTALLCKRSQLPVLHKSIDSHHYHEFLGLCSHEYFHQWHVKRICPSAFTSLDLSQENYTTLLWVFEGWTSYYDDLFLVRSQVITPKQYVTLLNKNLQRYFSIPGRHHQSLAEASWDAWIKLYRPNENAMNDSMSYYLKGALVALCLDLTIRQQTAGQFSLDHVMRYLWQETCQQQLGVEESTIPSWIQKAVGLDLTASLETWVNTCDELPLERLLATVGIIFKKQHSTHQPYWGWQTKVQAEQLVLTQVLNHSPAANAGLSAHDILIAINSLRVTEKSFASLQARIRPDDLVTLHYFRRDELQVTQLQVANQPEKFELQMYSEEPQLNKVRELWLQPSH